MSNNREMSWIDRDLAKLDEHPEFTSVVVDRKGFREILEALEASRKALESCTIGYLHMDEAQEYDADLVRAAIAKIDAPGREGCLNCKYRKIN